jgi:hypothetical protein
MEAGQPRIGRIDVGKVLNETFSVYGANFGTLIGGAIVIFTIAGVLQGFMRDEGGIILSLVAALVSLVANALFTGYVVSLVQDIRDGRRDFTAGQLASAASHAIWPLIGAGILAGIGIVIGFILLIIPGLFLLTIWAVISPAIVVERVGVFGSFGRSHELVRGDGWAVFGALVVGFLITAVAAAVATGIGAGTSVAVLIILLIVVSVLTAPIPALIASILFFDLGGGASQPAAAAPGEFSDQPPATA